jgi:pSer/pThr/pTyr-binding forkhead associated (FHA) protein
MTNLTKQRYIVRLHLKDREIATWILDDRPLAIGRTPENDIVIDNLSVSRQHARIEVGAEGPVIRDHSSTNGLMIDGRPVTEAAIENGMTIQIGKHVLSFEAEAANSPASGASTANAYEPTIQRTSTHRLANPAKLTESLTDGDREYLIDTAVFLIGKSDIADVHLEGMLVSEFHAEINFEENEHRLSHLAGRRKVTVNGETISECVLQDGDTIEIAGRSFVFRVSV